MTARPRDVVFIFHCIALQEITGHVLIIFARCVIVAPTKNKRHHTIIIFININVINKSDIDNKTAIIKGKIITLHQMRLLYHK